VSTRDVADLRIRDLCFIDVETTGSVIGYHEIIEIGVIRTPHDASSIVGEWERRLKPRFPERTSNYARNLTGYREDLWTPAETPSPQLWHDFVSFVTGAVPVCHNPSFDRAFITLAAADHQITELGLDYHWIGTESLAWPIYKAGSTPKLSLGALCALLGLEVEPLPHRALNGAKTCLEVYRGLMARLAPLLSITTS
jgi:DNA polymerase III alpha subunit (gram-positive type)